MYMRDYTAEKYLFLHLFSICMENVQMKMFKWCMLSYMVKDEWNKKTRPWGDGDRKLDSRRIEQRLVRCWRSLTPPLTISFITVLQTAQGSSTSNTHTHTAHCVGRHGITVPTASTLNSPKASSISKQGLNDLTLEGWQQPTFSFHLARRQGITEMNNSTQPRWATEQHFLNWQPFRYFSVWSKLQDK